MEQIAGSLAGSIGAVPAWTAVHRWV